MALLDFSAYLETQCFFAHFENEGRWERPPNGSRKAKIAKSIGNMSVFRKCLGGSLAFNLGGQFFVSTSSGLKIAPFDFSKYL